MKQFILSLTIVALSLPSFVSAQELDNAAPTPHQHNKWCGSQFTDADLEQLEEFTDFYYHRGGQATYTGGNDRAIKYVPLAVHLVADSDGNGRYPITKALDELCTLNADMAHTEIQFYLKYEFDLSINNTAWTNGTGGTQTTAAPQYSLMIPFNNETNAVNIYQVQKIRDDAGVAGVAVGSVFFNTNAPSTTHSAILIKKGAGGNDQTLAHEFGHNLSLPHTFYQWEGENYVCGSKASPTKERYNGSNCSSQGDRFCDTDPDYIADGFTCSSSSNFSTCLQMDADSATGYADGSNIMSYGFNCSNRAFSVDQIAAMNYHLEFKRPSFITYTPNTTAITGVATLDPASASFYDAVDFSWSAVANASHYIIEINRTATFAEGLMTDMAVVKNGTTYTSTQLDPNTTYRWRIRPYNEGYFCTNNSATGTFTTGEFSSSAKDIIAVNKIELLPNVSSAGQAMNLVIDANKSFDTAINIYSMSGQLLSSEQKTILSGSTVHPINTANFAAGLYLVAVQTENGVINKKLVITE